MLLKFQQIMTEKHYARMNWGKWNYLTQSMIIDNKLYEKDHFNDFIKKRQKYDPHNVFMNSYLSDLFLEPYES